MHMDAQKWRQRKEYRLHKEKMTVANVAVFFLFLTVYYTDRILYYLVFQLEIYAV